MRWTGNAVLIAAVLGGLACDDASLQHARDLEPKSHPNPTGEVLGPDCVKCTRAPEGRPAWEPARVVLFSGGVGAKGELLNALMQSLLGPRHEYQSPEDSFASVAQHPPPYLDEIYELLDAHGITASQAFDDLQFNGPFGVVAAMTLLPSGDYAGSAFDYQSGPVIPNMVFPIEVDGALYRDGKLFDPDFDGWHDARHVLVPGPMQPNPATGVSHMFLAFAANASRAGAAGLPPDGDYELRLSMVDRWFLGWTVTIPFKVGTGGDGGPPPPPGQVPLTPDAEGWFDGNNAAGVRGSWWATGDFYGLDGTAGQGACGMAGFQPPECSLISLPPLDRPFAPDPNGRGMCTAGVVGVVPIGGDGARAWSTTWGTIVGFTLAADDAGAGGPYDAIARKYTGFAFDIAEDVPGGHLRVEFATLDTNNNAAYWFGQNMDVSPVSGPGHYEIKWGEVGGPMYLGPSAPPFDPTRLTSIRFHVAPNIVAPIPYSFCVNNTAFLTE